MSYTPVPWKFEVVDETDSLLGCKRLNGGNGSPVIDLSDEWTGYPECGQDLQMTISKDDAALIAAAPEMLEALEGAKCLIESYVDFYGAELEHSEEYQDVENAIKKARGECTGTAQPNEGEGVYGQHMP